MAYGQKQWELETTSAPTKRGAGAEQENATAVRRSVETTMCNFDSDAYNADWTCTLPVQNQGSGDGPVQL
ncbi:hypothetical protein N7463_005115 [Penicillium fimorum]|uniref:Uncharacterized protein n=1 Tax=Penicillium fimorum TaxID=1882269 RepID=A0A9W9XST7_9EURO|nr:hypothetical protein N7463_005115 [Penicillium fimorum]